ncbi:MAG TPA: exodeoxyribonuclease VII large subunit [Spirochaetales bacterium]|nr:exodeoxyribonuclease VII large subunit [Spirochaetales bacterium]
MSNDSLLLQTELSVSELTSLIKRTLEEGFYGIRVSGEISNFRPASSGHWFFTLKDSTSSLSAIMFKSTAWRVNFKPQEGDKVVVTGSLDVYAARGTYQLKCDTMEKSGTGDILAMLEKRKREYDALGYFASERKKMIPVRPTRVGVVTSATSAALQDILQILSRRAPSLDILILPATVQGTAAAATIAARIRQANLLLLCDVLIVGRGGGSLEDLLPFSEDAVIQAIYESEIPVISAVGHEIDWALSDFVADLRAPTPSAAAELVSQGILDLRQRVETTRVAIHKGMAHRLQLLEHRIPSTEAMQRSMAHRMERYEYLLANASQSMSQAYKEKIEKNTQRVLMATRELQALSPLAILARGYTLVFDSEGKALHNREEAKVGEHIKLTFIDGSRKALIEE